MYNQIENIICLFSNIGIITKAIITVNIKTHDDTDTGFFINSDCKTG